MNHLNNEQMEKLNGGSIACLFAIVLPDQAVPGIIFLPNLVCIPQPCPPGQICPL